MSKYRDYISTAFVIRRRRTCSRKKCCLAWFPFSREQVRLRRMTKAVEI